MVTPSKEVEGGKKGRSGFGRRPFWEEWIRLGLYEGPFSEKVWEVGRWLESWLTDNGSVGEEGKGGQEADQGGMVCTGGFFFLFVQGRHEG